MGLSHKWGGNFLKYPFPGRGKFFICLNCLKITDPPLGINNEQSLSKRGHIAAETLLLMTGRINALLMTFPCARKLGNICCRHKMFLNKIRNIFGSYALHTDPKSEANLVCQSVCQCVSVSVCQCVSVSVCQCVSVSVCQCVSVSVCHFEDEMTRDRSPRVQVVWVYNVRMQGTTQRIIQLLGLCCRIS